MVEKLWGLILPKSVQGVQKDSLLSNEYKNDKSHKFFW